MARNPYVWKAIKNIAKDDYVLVEEESDLPGKEGETHQLKDGTEYEINGTVSISGNIRLANQYQIYGTNWFKDIINYTGTGALFVGTDKPISLRNVSFMAAMGSIFDVSANQTTEFLTQDCAVLAANSLGTISGYRVPSFKDFSFDSFNEGLTFKGNPDKIFMHSCPMRRVGDGATCVKFDGDAGLSVNLIHMEAMFFKDFGAGANSIEVTGDPLNDFAIVTSNLSDFDMSDSLVGVSSASPKWQFTGNSDITDSTVSGLADQSGTNTVSISAGDGDDTNPKIVNFTAGTQALERITESNGELTYTGIKDRSVSVSANATLQSTGGQEITITIYVGKNGSHEPVGSQTVTLGSGGESRSARAEAFIDVVNGDTLQVFIENNDSTNDIQFNDLDLIVRKK